MVSKKDHYRARLLKNRSVLLLVLTIGGVLILTSWLGAKDGDIVGTELEIFRLFNSIGGICGILFLAITQVGSYVFVWLITLLMVMLKKYWLGGQIFIAATLSWLGASFVKNLALRPRPYVLLENVTVTETKDYLMGYPSGHAAVAMGLVTVIMLNYKTANKYWFLAGVLLVGVSRMVVGVHAPYDIIGGVGIGLIGGAATNLVVHLLAPNIRNLFSDKIGRKHDK